jgi:hypothetical protein
MLREGANKNPRAKIFADEDEEEGGSNNSSALELNEREEELLVSLPLWRQSTIIIEQHKRNKFITTHYLLVQGTSIHQNCLTSMMRIYLQN